MIAQTEDADHQEVTETTADTEEGDTREVAPDHPDEVVVEDALILALALHHAGTAPDNPPPATKLEPADPEVEI